MRSLCAPVYLDRDAVLEETPGSTFDSRLADEIDRRIQSLVERKTAKVLFTRPGMEVRERYEISVDPRAYFDESDAALDRASKQVAAQIVTAILSNF